MNKTLISSLSFILILFAVVYFGILPIWSEIKLVKETIISKEGKIESEKLIVEELKRISQILDSNSENMEKLEKAMPEKDLKPELLKIMENVTSQNGLVLENISIESSDDDIVLSENKNDLSQPGEEMGNTEKSVSFRKVKINLGVSGNYSSFKNWLNAIESSLRITDISRIIFSVSGNEEEGGGSAQDPTMKYNIDMFAYSLSTK